MQRSQYKGHSTKITCKPAVVPNCGVASEMSLYSSLTVVRLARVVDTLKSKLFSPADVFNTTSESYG